MLSKFKTVSIMTPLPNHNNYRAKQAFCWYYFTQIYVKTKTFQIYVYQVKPRMADLHPQKNTSTGKTFYSIVYQVANTSVPAG